MFKTKANFSYSQCGEDLIVEFVARSLGLEKFTYLDIGAYHPIELSNTYLFYRKGHRGVCVEPDPGMFRLLKKHRGKDKLVHAGVGEESRPDGEFYVMSSSTLNTFSRETAERYAKEPSQKIERILKIPIENVNDIVRSHFDAGPNFVSLDVEGRDLQILKTFDFSAHRPEIFCVETLTYTEDNTERKLGEIIECMAQRGYMNYADTYINTIFVLAEKWKHRRTPAPRA